MQPLTPIRRQYLRIKRRYPHAIVFFRLGDFYETFDEDAELTARELEITLTSREMGKGQRVPMAGIPHHALDGYLARLIARGYKVAICEQLTPPGKGLVSRDVVRVVTPGTVVEPGLLPERRNNYLAAMLADGDSAGLAYVDISTGEFVTTQLPSSALAAELERLRPAELCVAEGEAAPSGMIATPLDAWHFDLEATTDLLLRHFGVASLDGFGLAGLPLAVRAAGAVLAYLEDTQRSALPQITELRVYSVADFMVLDAATRRNLELFQGLRSGTVAGSLLGVLDLTKTPMGARLLRRWLGQPLLDASAIERRLDAVAALVGDGLGRANVIAILGRVPDLERLVNRVHSGIATPRELLALRRGLEAADELKSALGGSGIGGIGDVVAQIHGCPDVVALVAAAIVDSPPPTAAEGGVIRPGFSPELDELEASVAQARQYLAQLERAERERTGIRSLRVGYNRVFGYYIEVTNPHRQLVPDDYIRKQTLAGAERYYTPELKEYEVLLLSATERRIELETAIYRQLCQQVGAEAKPLLETAAAIAELDVYAALGEVAARYGCRRPTVTTGEVIDIRGGRHPVVERFLPVGSFVPNDCRLNNGEAQIIVLTGPNMAGKSTYLRQVALIVLLAQIGSFVPAESAEIGAVDRIFTRIGAQDDLASGQSTFMVEMVETALILNQATRRSLLIFDEIGRGTSTFDGMSIARAVIEHIHNQPRLGAKTLFATHFYELTAIAEVLPRVRNFNVAVAEARGEVVFLHRILPGGADRSYGIHVARLAGLPRAVVSRAEEILADLEGRGDGLAPRRVSRRKQSAAPPQLPLFSSAAALLDEVAGLDLDSLTPLQALNKLYEMQRRAKEG